MHLSVQKSEFRFILDSNDLLYKIPFTNRTINNIWKKHWEFIIAIAIALFGAFVIMPKLMK